MDTVNMNKPRNNRALFALEEMINKRAHVNAKTMGTYKAKSTNIIDKKINP